MLQRSAPYHTINAALAVANDGDEIDVCPGIYAEQVVLTKPLTLRGMPVGSQQAVIMPAGAPGEPAEHQGASPSLPASWSMPPAWCSTA